MKKHDESYIYVKMRIKHDGMNIKYLSEIIWELNKKEQNIEALKFVEGICKEDFKFSERLVSINIIKMMFLKSFSV